MKFNFFGKIIFNATLFVTSFASAKASCQESGWALPISVNAGIGSMQDSKMDLRARKMTSASLEALPGYHFGAWMIGTHLDIRRQGQITSLHRAGGTNLKGMGYLLGLGVRYDVSNRFFTQTSTDFFGQYYFYRQNSSSKDVRLKSPLGIRIKSGYAFFEEIPNLTFDFDLHYLTYKKIQISEDEFEAATRQWMISVGLTYQIATATPSSVAKSVNTVPVMEAKTSLQNQDVNKPKEANPPNDSLVFKLSGNVFDFRSADLKPEAKAQLEDAAAIIVDKLAKDPSLVVRVEGHTDAIGNAARNQTLSLNRAISVKRILVGSGVAESRISIEGFGSSKPIADNNSEEGRAQNRRVDIHLEAETGE